MARGGSRYGAGRPGWRVKAEHCRSIDVRRFASEKMLQAGWWTWQWRDAETGEVQSAISVYGSDAGLRLAFCTNGMSVEQWLQIEHTPCAFGGARPWFACPSCGRRAAKLFLLNGRFACRKCQRLTYASRSEDDLARAWRKQSKLEKKLGENWTRPRHMHHATRDRIVAAIFECEQRREDALAFWFDRLLPR